LASRKPPYARALASIATVALLALLAFAAPAAAAPEYRGVMLHSLWSDSSEADMDRELDLARGAGANVVRVDVVWGSLETGGKGQYSPWYVQKLDRFMAGANARGMKVIATLWSSPCWASTAPPAVKQGCSGDWWDREVGSYPPADAADYGDAAHFITSRYGTKLAALEVWNEPNLETGYFWKAQDKAGAYANLLKAAYPRAKAGNAQVPVLAGSLAFADRPFLDQLNAHGINDFHDGISIHPYNEWRHPADRWKDEWKRYSLLAGTEWVRQGQQAVGDNEPIWLTEFGWTTGSSSGWKVTEAQQARFVGAGFGVLAAVPYVRAAVVYNLREKGTDPASHEDNFGLVNRDFTPKPAYAALRTALGGAPAKRRKRRPLVSVRVRRVGRSSLAVGRAPRRSRLGIRVWHCGHRNRLLRSRASRLGRFTRRVGFTRRLRGCRLTVRLRHRRQQVAVVSVVRARR